MDVSVVTPGGRVVASVYNGMMQTTHQIIVERVENVPPIPRPHTGANTGVSKPHSETVGVCFGKLGVPDCGRISPEGRCIFQQRMIRSHKYCLPNQGVSVCRVEAAWLHFKLLGRLLVYIP